MDEEVEDFLAHYGVKGMKWGVVKKDKPSSDSKSKTKEVDPEKAAKRKAKADDLRSKADDVQKQIDDLKANGGNTEYMRKKYGNAMGIDTRAADMRIIAIYGHTKQSLINAEIKNLQNSKDHYLADAKAVDEGRLTSKQKMLVGGLVATTILAGAAGVAIYANTGDRAKKRKYYQAKEARLAAEAAAQKRLDDIKAGQKISFDDFNTKLNKTEMSRISGMSKDAFHAMDDTPIVGPAGHVFKRMSTNPEEKLRKEVYAAFKDDDVDRYRAMLPKFWSQWGIGSDRRGGYEINIKAVEDIVSPGKKERVQTLIDLMDEKIVTKNLAGEKVTKTGRDWLNSSNLIPMADRQTLSNEDAAIKAYNDFALMIGGNSTLKNAYVKKLQQKGYNAIIDDNDSGKLSDAPMFIFDTTKSMQRLGATVLTPENIAAARERLIELADRR